MATFRFNRWIWAALLWTGVIFFSSTTAARRIAERGYDSVSKRVLPAAKSPAQADLAAFAARKGLHFTLFFVLGILLWLAIEPHRHKNRAILVAGLIAGAASELLQWFFPLRTPLLLDAALNTTSTAAGLLMAELLTRVRVRLRVAERLR